MSSKYIPNSFQTPNAIIDDLMPLLTDSEFRVLMFMTRHILGWGKSVESRRAHISQSIIANGYSYTNQNGDEVVIRGCGLALSTVRATLKRLKEFRIVTAIGKPTNDGQLWELSVLTTGDIAIEELMTRYEKKNKKHKQQTKKARKNNPNFKGGIVQQLPHRGDSSTITQGDSSTITQGDSSTIPNETHRKHMETHTTASNDAQPESVDGKTSTNKNDDTTANEKDGTQLQSDEFEKMVQHIQTEMGMPGTRAMNIYHLLRGTSKKPGYKEYTKVFQVTPMSYDELVEFWKWYQKHNQGCDLKSPEKIESYVIAYRESRDTYYAKLKEQEANATAENAYKNVWELM